MLIYCGAGHGKHTAGKRSPSGKFEEREWFFNNEVIKGFISEMKSYKGVKIVRTDDPTGERDVPLRERTNSANNAKADVYISFHHNAYQSKWGTHSGTEVYYSKGSKKGLALAKAVAPVVANAYGLSNRGVKNNNLHITRETHMPAILIEGGFMDSSIDIKKMRDKKLLRNAGIEIAKAVAKHYGLSGGGGGGKVSTPSKTTKSSNKTTSKGGNLGLVDWMKSQKMDSSYSNRKKLAAQYGIKGYKGTENQNITLLSKLKGGKPKSKPKKKTSSVKSGNTVTLKKSAKRFTTGETIASHAKGKKYQVHQTKGNKVLLKSGGSYLGWVRKSDVSGGSTTTKSKSKSKTFKVGKTVTLKKSASRFATGETIASHAKGKRYKIIQVKSDRVLLDKIMSWVKKSDVQ